jgi:hypothetical protein
MATLQPMTDLPSSGEELAALLREHGYDASPLGLARKDRSDYVISPEKEIAFLDINADAVRRNGKVPERPIRLTFYLAVHDGSVLWKSESVSELESGVESKCLDRNPDTPEENAPWPP